MKMNKVDLSFQSCTATYDEADVVIFSVPMDNTASFRPGTRFAGHAIRVDSFGVEWYSPYRDMDLKEHKTCDIGDLELPFGDIEEQLRIVYETTKQIIKDGKVPMMVGGEHLASYSTIKAVFEKYPNLHIIQLDAHTDLRESFFGRELSHATFLRHVHKFVGDGKIFQFGIRSGEKPEFEWAKSGHTHLRKFDFEGLDEVCQKLKDVPVYVTIDIDVLDPAVVPGTGTPEPGGMQYKDLLWAFDQFDQLNHLVAADFVELSPMLDPSGASTAVAAKSLRELVLLLHKKLNK
jgi:agmatinase